MTSDAGSWQPEARALARVELDRRGVRAEAITDGEHAFTNVSIALQELRERHAQQSYTMGKMAGIFLAAPFLLLGKLFGKKVGLDVKLGLSDLDRRNFKKKYRQRMAMLILGTVAWATLLGGVLGK